MLAIKGGSSVSLQVASIAVYPAERYTKCVCLDRLAEYVYLSTVQQQWFQCRRIISRLDVQATLSSFYRHRWEAPTDSHEALSNSWVLEIMLARGMMKFLDREPVAVVSLAIGIFGFCIPLVVPPIRESMGLSTKQVGDENECIYSTVDEV